ncbi:hypothetical protein M404DRAFT_579053 [Pisolithus tinctorius Marx 270]|uniref:Uncharacterized protein n=1 Tax=Pisolithus tinctorius Marx 270 TaxID=870435 RepID=A0A0C3JWE5_PISTI|nr:hypothetical protein M404DRAFT_579053 [Pisolithus tinctorius Marx 270]
MSSAALPGGQSARAAAPSSSQHGPRQIVQLSSGLAPPSLFEIPSPANVTRTIYLYCRGIIQIWTKKIACFNIPRIFQAWMRHCVT